MKFLIISALLATAAQAVDLAFLNDIPVDGNYTIGTDFVLEWKPYNAAATDTFQLQLSAWNNTVSGYYPGPFGSQLPAYDTIEIVLDDAVKFVDGHYAWSIKPIDEKGVWKGPGFYYSFTAHWTNTWDSPRSFHIAD
ncbi:hypothetical protein HD806DRAFT_508638 [Xylariaceae sp. AK1471]|nr:hypothetical protein HD806DRAFT_508638 [Xylariaceae sp. AK1471]